MIVWLVWAIIPLVLIGIIGIQESLGDQASGKPAWVTNSDKVCGDRLCSDIQDSNEEILNARYLCEDTYGKWISGHNECETDGYGNTTEAFQSYCKEFNGDYTYCHSGCRNVEGFDDGKVVCAAQCVQVCEFSVSTAKIFSPKKQMAMGVTVFDVVCKEGLELIFKSTNGYPACVKSSTAEKLIERGWARDGGPIYTRLLSPEECKEQGGKYNHCPLCPEGAFCEPCTEFCRIE